MAEGVNVQTLEVLRDLEAALRRFAGEAQEALRVVEGEIRQTREWLEDRVAHWRHEVERHEEEMRAAEELLDECRESGGGDCGEEEEQYRRARARLEAATEELAMARRWAGRAERAVMEYQRLALRCHDLVGECAQRGCLFLERRLADLQRYLIVSGAEAASGTAGPEQGPPATAAAEPMIAGGDEERQKLAQAMTLLRTCSTGVRIAGVLAQRGTHIAFGQWKGNRAGAPIAWYSDNKITINVSERSKPSAVLAAHLAHESVHAQWDSLHDSLQEEYEAYLAESQVWQSVKSNGQDDNCDGWHAVMSRREMDAKITIIRCYRPRELGFAGRLDALRHVLELGQLRTRTSDERD